MSRIGKQPITLESGVEFSVQDGIVTMKGPKGTLTQKLHTHVSVAKDGNTLRVTVADPESQDDKALWGLFQRLILNMATGVTKGFEKRLEVNGVGYKIAIAGKKLTLHLGFSHPIDFELPAGIEGKIEKNVIILSGSDKQLVGEIAAQIRRLRKPEPYKGKGIKYSDEEIPKRSWFIENAKMVDGRSDSKENDRPTIPAIVKCLSDPDMV